MLELVSTTAQEDSPPQEPSFGRHYDFVPPVQLSDYMVYTNGQPYEAYARMRENAPVCWCTEDEFSGFWALTRYEDIRAVELDTATFSSQRGGINMNYGPPETRHPLLNRAAFDNMICLDAPVHLQLRREHMPFFTASYVADLRKKVDAQVTKLLDDMAAKGPVLDLVENFSAELPLFTLSEILGIPEADRPKLVRWMHYLELAQDALTRDAVGEMDPAFMFEFLTNVQEMFDYGQSMLQARRAEPRNDLLSAIANAEVDGAPLPDEFLDGSWLLIVFAGNDTTRNSISGSMRLLSQFPDQKQRLIQDASLLPNFVHEAIRMVSPVIYMRRTATCDTEISGQRIAEGEKVLMYYGAANRDPSVFETPDQFDVARPNAKEHIAFGLGPHVCLGQRIANMQLEAAFAQILARFPEVVCNGDFKIAPSNFVHAISYLEVDLGKR
ncbi:MAG: cytochrome P450 [Aquisalinus sp.]|nr:cytochrome P450 [Aquisalinus sp.]